MSLRAAGAGADGLLLPLLLDDLEHLVLRCN